MNISHLLSAAEDHLKNDRDDVAQKLFVEALDYPEGAAQAMAGLGKIAIRAGEIEKAQDLFGRALAIEPNNAFLLVGLATVYQLSERTEDAETCLRRAMRLDPALPEAHTNLALVLLIQQDIEGAYAEAKQAFEIAPDSPDTLEAMAQVEIARGNIAMAITLFQRILALTPQNLNALTNLGTLFQLINEPDKAIEYLETARLQDPDAPHILTRLAECKTAMGQLEDAEKLIQQAAVIAPSDAEVRNAEGAILLHRGRFAEALTALQAASELDPQNPAPLINLALLLRRNNELEAALATARQAIELSENTNETAHQIVTDLLFLSGNYQEGWQSFGIDVPEDATAQLQASTKLALLVEDLSSALVSLRLLPQLSEQRVRLLCLPAFARFFRAIDGIESVHPQEEIDLSKDIEAEETVLLLDDLARILQADSPPTTPLRLNLEAPLPSPEHTPRIGFWWDDASGGPDPQTLLNALPATPVLLREPHPSQNLILPDGQPPQILIDHSVEDLLDMATALLSLDMIVAIDSPVAHLAANLGCQTLVLCHQYDIPWYWQPCGPEGAQWYPTAQAVGRDIDGAWNGLIEACANIPIETSVEKASTHV